MADPIDKFVDRNGVTQDKEYMVQAINEVIATLNKLDNIKVDLKGAFGLTGLSPLIQQTRAGFDSLAAAEETVARRMEQLNGKSKEYTDLLLKQTKAQKEAAQAALVEAKVVTESAKARQAEAKATADATKAKEADKRATKDAYNDYLQLSKAYNEAAMKAKIYFVTLGENHPVTQQAIKDANDIGNVVKRADAAVGQFQRNVGNYRSAFDGLGFSFAQIGRELPSLAINFQTFALAISNNLPIVADELRKASTEIARLKAEGKETPSLFQRIKSAVLSPQTALSAGIALFTIFAGKLFSAGDASEALKNQTEDLTRALREQAKQLDRVNKLVDDQTEIDLNNLKASGASKKQLYDREVQGIKDKLNQERQANKDLNDKLAKETQDYLAYRKLIGQLGQSHITKSELKAVKEKYRVLAEEIQNSDNRIIDLETALQKKAAERRAEIYEDTKADAEKANADRKEAARRAKAAADAELQAQYEIKALELQQQIDFNKEISDDETKTLFQRLAALRRYKDATVELILLKADTEKLIGEKTATELKLVEAQKNDALLRLDREFIEARRKLQADDAARQIKDEGDLQRALEKVIEEGYNRFEKKEAARKKKQEDESQKRKKEQADLLKQVQQFREQLATELINTANVFLSASLERQKNEIQDQINLLDEKKAKEIELANQTIASAQERAAAIAIIEARAQAQKEALIRKQKELDIKKAQFDKAAAIARIVQETAVSIISSLKTPALIPLIAAIAAAQLAAVIAQPIPRYFKGKNVKSFTDNYEGPALVDDGGKPEVIIRENGTAEIGGSTPRMTYLKARDIVLPSVDMLIDHVIAGKMGGRLRVRSATGDPGSRRIEQKLDNVVKAIKEKETLKLSADHSGLTAMWQFGANQIKYIEENTNWKE